MIYNKLRLHHPLSRGSHCPFSPSPKMCLNIFNKKENLGTFLVNSFKEKFAKLFNPRRKRELRRYIQSAVRKGTHLNNSQFIQFVIRETNLSPGQSIQSATVSRQGEHLREIIQFAPIHYSICGKEGNTPQKFTIHSIRDKGNEPASWTIHSIRDSLATRRTPSRNHSIRDKENTLAKLFNPRQEVLRQFIRDKGNLSIHPIYGEEGNTPQ